MLSYRAITAAPTNASGEMGGKSLHDPMDTQRQQRVESNRVVEAPFTFYEFFAGGGMARLGLGPDWRCIFANEWCEKKAAAYRSFFGKAEVGVKEPKVADVKKLSVDDFPGTPTLVWASFPCQDLSVAGSGAGLKGDRSGTFKPFWNLIQQMVALDRIPKLVVLENVVGALTSHRGRDFTAICDGLAGSGYAIGAMVIDAVRFLPQSRPRLFIIGVRSEGHIPRSLIASAPNDLWHTRSVQDAYARLPEPLKERWLWWNLPAPNDDIKALSDLIEENPTGVKWHTVQETKRLVSLMSPLHLEKLAEVKKLRKRIVGTIYKRMRPGEGDDRVQRAEVRFDQISGCLRTPVGGSSRQVIIIVNGNSVRSRLLSPREAARLMGVPETYPLPQKYNDAYHLFGDGLAVPVVGWLELNLLRPLASAVGAAQAA